jgi:hypothetical protein
MNKFFFPPQKIPINCAKLMNIYCLFKLAFIYLMDLTSNDESNGVCTTDLLEGYPKTDRNLVNVETFDAVHGFFLESVQM